MLKEKEKEKFEIPPQKRINSGTYGISRAFSELDEFMHEVQGDVSTEENALEYERLLNACYASKEDALFYAAIFDKEMKARIEARKAEVKRLEGLNKIDAMMQTENKSNIRRLLDFIGTTKVQVKHLVVSIRGNGGKVPLDINPVMLPEEYVRHVPMPIREEIEAALKENPNLYIPGVTVLERGDHVSIK
jgi:hypothetical protein